MFSIRRVRLRERYAVTVPTGPCPSASDERGKRDRNLRYETTQIDPVRGGHFGEGRKGSGRSGLLPGP